MSLWGDSTTGNFLRVVALVLSRFWGDQTKTEAGLRKLAEEAAAKKKEAWRLWMEAQKNGQSDDVVRYHSAYNSWDTELKRLQQQAAADRS